MNKRIRKKRQHRFDNFIILSERCSIGNHICRRCRMDDIEYNRRYVWSYTHWLKLHSSNTKWHQRVLESRSSDQMILSAKHLLLTDHLPLTDNSVGYGKVVDTLSVDDVIEFDKSGIRIVLVRNPVSDEVREAIKNTSLNVYDDINEERVQQVLSMLENMKGDATNET